VKKSVNIASSSYQYGAMCVDYRLKGMRLVDEYPQWLGGVASWLASHTDSTNETVLDDIALSMGELKHTTFLEQ
jgi:hypothetical protein